MSKYKRTTNRQSWSESLMQEAVAVMMSKEMGSMRASKQFGVPQTTLERRVKKVKEGRSDLENAGQKGLGRFQTVFSEDQEKELVSHILNMEQRLFGFSVDDLRALAFELAERNGINHNFNLDEKKAGKCWYYSFLKRNPSLSLRTPEPYSFARATGFNKVSVGAFFTLLSQEVRQYNFTADRIWNVDETGVSTVTKKKSKIIALRGKKQVGKLSSAERGTLVTVTVAMNAIGNYLPLMFIFPRKRENLELLDHAPPGSFAQFHESGWMQKEFFLYWFQKFVEFTNPSAEKPVLLLLLDGHATHTKSLELVLLARSHHVIIICFPPHCTHRMQPLDVALMAPLSTYYSKEVEKWLQHHPGRVVTDRQIAELYGKAFMKAALMETAVNGFRSTGIHPLDPNVFPDYLFAPSLTTERPEPVAQPIDNEDVSQPGNALTSAPEPNPVSNTELPGCSKDSISFAVSPSDIAKLPQVERNRPTTKRHGNRGRTAVLTSTPYKDELESATKKRLTELERKRSKGQKNSKAACSKRIGETKTARKLFQDSTTVTNRRQNDKNGNSEDDENDDPSCLYCDELYSASATNEQWVQCLQCKNWAHVLCSAVDKDDDKFLCDFCA